jgi:hypothetical protein
MADKFVPHPRTLQVKPSRTTVIEDGIITTMIWWVTLDPFQTDCFEKVDLEEDEKEEDEDT